MLRLALTIKVLLLVFGGMAFQATADTPLSRPRDWLEIWNRWDAPHYLNLANHGYAGSGDPWLIVFFPLYPWLVRAGTRVTGDPLLSAFLVSTIASLLAAALFFRLVRLDYGPALTWRALWFLLVFPTSLFLHIGYTEGLFLALVLGALFAARKDAWLLAGILGALAALTRANGVVLVPALMCEAYTRYRLDREWRWSWLFSALTLVGVSLYLLLNYQVAGHPLAFLEAQQAHFSRSPSWPWAGVLQTWKSLRWRSPADAQMLAVHELTYVALGLGGALASWKWLRPSYAAWMTGNWLVFTAQGFVYSVPRFTLTLFPLFVLFALATRQRVWFAALTAWSILFLGLFATLFVQGKWVS